jgi:DNA-binding Lrp family transcriptional regulator
MAMKKQKVFEPDFLNIPYVVMHMQPADRFTFGAIYMFSSLSQKRCIASNVEIGRIAKISPESVSNSLNKLEEEGFIKRHFKDNNKRTRDWIEVLVGFVKIPSGNGIDTISRLDKIPSTDEHIKNIDKETVVEDNKEDFNLEKETQRLLDYQGERFYFLNIIGIFIKRKKPDLRNKKQFNKFVKDYTWAAKQLEIYDNDQIIKAIKQAEEMVMKKIELGFSNFIM